MLILKSQIRKAKKNDYMEASRQLRQFLKLEEPKLGRIMVWHWNKQINNITYKEIKEAILNGEIDEKTMYKWLQDYSKLINNEFVPRWIETAKIAQEQLKRMIEGFSYQYSLSYINYFVENRAAELVVDMTETQRKAINGLVQQAIKFEEQSIDSLAYLIRPTIGLYPQQAKANFNYYQTIRKNLLETNPTMKQATAEKLALKKTIQYGDMQHRYRANMIARTELCNAYNSGEFGAVEGAINEGLIGDCSKTWVDSGDVRACNVCKSLNGTTIKMNELFLNKYQHPTAHPHCRCVLIYTEI